MPGRDYTRAFELFRDTLDDGYYGERHLNRYSFGSSFSFGTLPGDLWMQSLIEKEKDAEHGWHHEDDQKISPTIQSPSYIVRKTPESTGDLCTTPPPPARSLFNKKSKTRLDFLQLPTPESTPSSSAEQFHTQATDDPLSSSYTASFRTARETTLTSTPGSYQQLARFGTVDSTGNASVETLQERHMRQETRAKDMREATIGGVRVHLDQLQATSQGQGFEQVDDHSQLGITEPEHEMPLLGHWSSRISKNKSHKALQSEGVINTTSTPAQSTESLQSFKEAEPARPSTPQPTRVIEALVIDTTPPHRKRKLRHAVKDLDLRDTASNSEHSNRTSYSDASVLASKAPKVERLSTQLQAMPSLESDRSGSAGSRTLRHARKLRSPSPSPLGRSDHKAEHESPIDPALTTQLPPTDPSIANLPGDLPTAHQLEREAADAPKRTTRTPVPSVLSPELLRDVYSPKHTRHFSATSGTSYDGRKPSTASDMVGLGILDNLSPLGMSYSRKGSHQRIGSHQSSILQGSLRRPSDNASIMSSVASPRSYHFRSRSSPVSFNSEGNYTPNLVEATAISLFPHHNTSLLLVQQQGLSDQRNLPDLEQSSSPAHPTITIDLPANDFGVETRDYRASSHDSEHEQNRKTTPPSFQLIPPTPGDERASGMLVPVEVLEDHNTNGAQATSDLPPTRQSSLFKRARAYSNSTIQPFLSRTFSNQGSVRRTTSRRKKLFDSGARLSRTDYDADMTEEDRNLHPFWQPRDFWDGVEEEERDDESGSAMRGLPEDNTAQAERDVQQPKPPISWRRGGSLRFLIGNSLGIDRQPTNRRLPMVRWPSRKTTEKKKTSRVFVHGHTLRTVRSVTVLGRMRQSMGGGRASRGSRDRRTRWKKGLRCGL